MTEIDYQAEQRLCEIIYDMNLTSVEEWCILEENAKKHCLESPTEAFEHFRKVTGQLNAIIKNINSNN